MKLKILVLVLALQTAWILGTTFVQERVLAGGKVVLLETRPVDPRDLLRGDYVILNYRITVQAAMPDSGQARIKEVFVDSKPYIAAMKGMAQ